MRIAGLLAVLAGHQEMGTQKSGVPTPGKNSAKDLHADLRCPSDFFLISCFRLPVFDFILVAVPREIFEEDEVRFRQRVAGDWPHFPGEIVVQDKPVPPPLPDPAAALCANCASPLAGPYCAQCGQHVGDYHRSLLRLISEFFDSLFCWDNKWFRTLQPLLTTPGVLTQEFMRGRRMRYVSPLRLFLFTSAVCLALLQFEHDHSRSAVKVSMSAKDRRALHETLAKIKNGDLPIGEDDRETPPPVSAAAAPSASPAAEKDDDDDDKSSDSKKINPPAQAALSPVTSVPAASPSANSKQPAEAAKAANAASEAAAEHKMPWWVQEVARQAGDQIEKAAEKSDSSEARQQAVQNIERRASWASLAILPLFALLLQMVYRREDSLYFGHLIFSLHYHTFLLLFWTVHSLVERTQHYVESFPIGFIMLVSWLWPPVYLYVALRRIYDESPRDTKGKVLLIGTVHLLALIAAVSIIEG